MNAVDSQSRSEAELDPIRYWIEFTEAGAEAGKVAQWKQELSAIPRPR